MKPATKASTQDARTARAAARPAGSRRGRARPRDGRASSPRSGRASRRSSWCPYVVEARRFRRARRRRSFASRFDNGSSSSEHGRLTHERTAHRDTLALTAGELPGSRSSTPRVRAGRATRRDALPISSAPCRARAAETRGCAARSCAGRARSPGRPSRRYAADGVRSLAIAAADRSVPESTVSRPATMRSSVDFPQPDGPTRTMSSPSSTCSVSRRARACRRRTNLSMCSQLDVCHRSMEEPPRPSSGNAACTIGSAANEFGQACRRRDNWRPRERASPGRGRARSRATWPRRRGRPHRRSRSRRRFVANGR